MTTETMKMSKMLTEAPLKALLRFALPLLAGSILQNLYQVIDTMIVGRLLGKEALSAVGNSYVPTLVVNSILLGVSSGISIFVSQAHGAQGQTAARKWIGPVHAVTVLVGVGLPALALLSADWVFGKMHVPETAAKAAGDYWKITAAGIPFSVLYQFHSAVLQAKGNSRLPVQSMGFSCAINLFLDLLFVGALDLGVRGAAGATVLSQAAAAGISVLYLFHLDRAFLAVCFDLHSAAAIVKLSLTGILQNSASAVSMFFLQGLINQYGVNAIAAYTSAYRIEGILTLPAASLGTALSVFVGQNIGAGQRSRGFRDLGRGSCFPVPAGGRGTGRHRNGRNLPADRLRYLSLLCQPVSAHQFSAGHGRGRLSPVQYRAGIKRSDDPGVCPVQAHGVCGDPAVQTHQFCDQHRQPFLPLPRP